MPAPNISITTTVVLASSRVAIPTDAVFVRIASSTGAWFRLGNSTVNAAVNTANNHYLGAGQSVVIEVGSNTHVAIIRDTADGVASVSIATSAEKL